jgi:uncharacterized protein DUF29
MAVKDLYDRDLFEWAVRNAELLRAGRLEEADIDHIAEEIETMAGSQRRELRSRLRVLIAHLLKWQFQPGFRGPSWRKTIRTQRVALGDLLQEAPSLRYQLQESWPEVYERAVADAEDDTGLSKSSFPETSPFSLDQILDYDFYPG